MSFKDELNLIKAAQKGDDEGWCHIVKNYSKVVWSATNGYGFSIEDREDISQEVFTKLVGSINSYDHNKAGFSTYITIITKRLCIDRIRGKNSEKTADPEKLENYTSIKQGFLCI